ncbi:MAG TPA: hypothetical protein VH062_03190 [Polyangiaceae bacterium]|jgi:hypothetical protein|nr:hypothetical protein [Polyangiaceae bacterium]
MRLITGMLTTALVCGCGQADDTTTAKPSAPTAAAVPGDTGEVSAALRVGRRPPRLSARVRKALAAGAGRLSDLQADRIGDNAHNGLDDDDPDDGGWDFTLAATVTEHTTTASSTNTYGATALGPWAAVRAGADTQRYRTTLLGAGLGSQEITDIDSPNDFVFLPLLGELQGDTAYAELARARYDAKLTSFGGAAALAGKDRDARHASAFDGLILYDLAWYTLGAAALDAAFPGSGYDADTAAFAAVAVAAISGSAPLFDINDANEQFYVQGLAWSLVVLDHATAPANLTTTIRGKLRDLQGSDGAWGFNATTPTDDLQSTAHAVQALALTAGDTRRGRNEATQGARFILSKQAANGGWEYTPGKESTLVDAESMLALYLSQAASPEDALDPGPTSDIGTTSQALVVHATVPVAAPLAAPAD